MINLIEQLQNTTKRNEKLKILENYKNNPAIKELIYYTYNPRYQYFVKKIWEPEKIGHKDISKNFIDAVNLLEHLRKRHFTGHEALQKIKDFMETLNKESQEIFKLILTKDLKSGINIKSLNKIWKDFLPEEEFQLAEKYNPEKDYKVDFYWYSPKLDGLRMRVEFDNMVPMGRNGKEIKNTFWILEQLETIKEYNPDIEFVDGEVYSPELSFNEIMSLVTKEKFKDDEEKVNHQKMIVNKLEYHIFACLSKDVRFTKDMIRELNNIQKCVNKFKLSNIKIVPQQKIKNDYNIIINTMKKYVNMGYEGIMLRHPHIAYDFKRNDNLLKVKPIYEADLEIIDAETGNITMYENNKPIQVKTVSALICKGIAEDNKRKEQVYTKVGSGLTFDIRKEIFNNPDKYIGKIIEVEFQEISKNKDSKSNWSLRFPVFKRFRFDK